MKKINFKLFSTKLFDIRLFEFNYENKTETKEEKTTKKEQQKNPLIVDILKGIFVSFVASVILLAIKYLLGL